VDLQVLFGVSVTVPTMLSKLNTRYPPQQITEKTMRTLRDEGSCGLCVFDNWQMIKCLKFQRGGHSSETSFTASRLIVRLTVPRFISLLRWAEDKVPLTYYEQIIPSPSGMLTYESIDDITPDIFDGSTVCSTQIDVTDKRVNAWYSLATLASQIYRLQRLVKTKDTDRFQFQYDDCVEAMKRMNVNSKLRKKQNWIL